MAKWIEDPQGRLEVEKVTEEIKLPVWKANYKGKFREFWNECWEKIEDSFLKLKKSNEGKEPAIEDKQTAFNKAFGTVEDTVLEGNKFTQMTGKDYGGILNIAGQKEAGKAYWDNNTKKLYICKNNNSDISPNVNNYIPFDSNSLLERLENLFNFNLIKTSQNKGYKFYIKNSYTGNYIDVSDTFSSIDFCLLSPARTELTDAEARFINYQGFVNGKILINAYWLNGNSLEKKYSATPSDTLLTASCVVFVYGTLK